MTSSQNLTHSFVGLKTTHRIPLLGLYADHANTVRVTFLDDADTVRGERVYTITTKPLIADLPEVRIDIAEREKMSDGWTMVGYEGFYKGNHKWPNQPFLFDSHGNIRWYLDLRGHRGPLKQLHFHNGLARLANGNLFFGDNRSDRIFEMDMLGNIINEWALPGFGFHHHIIEKADGNFLITAEKLKAATLEDWIIELSPADGAIIRRWDLKEPLQYERRAMLTGLLGNRPPDKDWFHGNAVVHLPDDAMLVSGRHQGLAKISADNRAMWILAPHRGWGVAGNGDDLRTRLLQPLDSAGVPITDEAVLSGEKSHADFDWPWYQHSPVLLPDGNILLFDNGENRRYQPGERYSRAVEYAIDEEAMTVQQVWAWGRQRGRAFYSAWVSGVEYITDDDHVIVSSGMIASDSGRTGKVVELDYSSKAIIFEATITPPTTSAHVFTRTERMPLYPPTISPTAPSPHQIKNIQK